MSSEAQAGATEHNHSAHNGMTARGRGSLELKLKIAGGPFQNTRAGESSWIWPPDIEQKQTGPLQCGEAPHSSSGRQRRQAPPLKSLRGFPILKYILKRVQVQKRSVPPL